MKTFHDFESMGAIQNIEEAQVPVLETLSGSQVVSWYTMIDDFLQRKLDDQEAARNHENADRLRAFLNTWRDNELTGAISVDQLLPLKAASEQAAAVKSALRPIFTSILRNLRKLIADEEQLPRGVDTNSVNPMGGGGMGSAPPMSPDFGPDEEAPPGEEGQPGEEGAAGMEQPEDENAAMDKIMTAAESLIPVSNQFISEEQGQDDLRVFREMMAEFQDSIHKPMDQVTTDEVKQWMKMQLRFDVRQRVMAYYLFRMVFVKGMDEQSALQKWQQREPALRADFENDPETIRRWGGKLRWQRGA